MFDKFCESEVLVRDVTVWNSIIDGHFRFGHIKEGVDYFCRMQLLGMKPDAFSLCILLGVCDGGVSGYMEGKQIHGYIIRNVFGVDSFLETALIDMYWGCGQPMYGWRAFVMMEHKDNVVLWNVMIGGFCENGLWENSLELYSEVKNENIKPVSNSFTSTLSACCHGEIIGFGRQVHVDVVKMGFDNDSYVCTSLLTMYAKCEQIKEAERVFYQTADGKIELWNAMIAAYASNGCVHEALEVYKLMRLCEMLPDSFTLSNVISSSSMLELYDYGKSIHAEVMKRPIQDNITVQSALVTMYSKCGNNDDAGSVFNKMKERDVIAWGSMVSGFCQNGKFKEALQSFKAMEVQGTKPDSHSMASTIGACTGLENLAFGCQIHAYVIKVGLEVDLFVASSLIDMYSKCGFSEMAGNVFSCMLHKNLVAWNSMISCYSRNGLLELSIRLFLQIVEHGLYPDSASITSVLIAVSSIAAPLKGKTLHGYLIRLKIPSDIQVENALIDMYIKCGILQYAQNIFQNMSLRNLITWNSMISGYASHGEFLKAMRLFDVMKRCGITPDHVTFLSLISACKHSGFVDEGQNLFKSMREDYGIEPEMEHYVNIVDLLGRAGCLEDAYNFVKNMLIEADRSIWLCLLFACRAHGNVELGELAAFNLLKLEPSRGSNYSQLMNLYGEAELWDKAAELRISMKEKGLKKNPGCSWIEVRNRIAVFFSGDSSSPRTVEIFDTLNNLRKNMEKKESYCGNVESLQE